MASLIRYEGRGAPLAPRATFLMRIGRNVGVALVAIAVSLLAGMLGYHGLEHLNWLD